MATTIRLKRIGRRNRPFYRVVTMDSRNRRDGAAIEELGWYNPVDSEDSFKLKIDRVLHWLEEGAQLSKAAKKLMRRAGINHRWHLMKQGLEGNELEKEMQKWELEHAEVLMARKGRNEEKESADAKKQEKLYEENNDTNDDILDNENDEKKSEESASEEE